MSELRSPLVIHPGAAGNGPWSMLIGGHDVPITYIEVEPDGRVTVIGKGPPKGMWNDIAAASVATRTTARAVVTRAEYDVREQELWELIRSLRHRLALYAIGEELDDEELDVTFPQDEDPA
jgi:hypothetical protein